MADLDDFFAKKDRKKSKTKKFPTTEELAKKYAEDTTAKKVEVNKPRKERLPAAAAGIEGEEIDVAVEEKTQAVEDEWKDFEEEERKDYTGLKIGQMQINDEDNFTGSDGEQQGEVGSDGEFTSDNPDKSKSGPWQKVSDDQLKEQQKAPVVPVHEKAPVSKTYISPALRYASNQPQARLRKDVLPDIHNQEYFPVLGSAKPEEVKKKKPEPGYEEVRHGGRIPKSSELSTNAPVAIGNRFTELQDS